MTYYALQLENIQNEKPEVIEYLKNGAFSVNRTGKPLSRVTVDMALEQTINAEAKNRLKGIMAFADINLATNISNEEMFNEHDKDSDDNIYESDESGNDDGSDYDDF